MRMPPQARDTPHPVSDAAVMRALDVIHQEGGGPFEAMDLPPETRHLDLCHSLLRLLDRSRSALNRYERAYLDWQLARRNRDHAAPTAARVGMQPRRTRPR